MERTCGIYFRFPTDYLEDLYWDDNYDGPQQFSTWLRRRHTGPYEYDGQREGFLQCYKEASDFYKRFPVIDVQPSFVDTLKHLQKRAISKRFSPQKATLAEVFRSIFFESAPPNFWSDFACTTCPFWLHSLWIMPCLIVRLSTSLS